MLTKALAVCAVVVTTAAISACGSSSSTTSAGSSGGGTVDIYSSLPLTGASTAQTKPMVKSSDQPMASAAVSSRGSFIGHANAPQRRA